MHYCRRATRLMYDAKQTSSCRPQAEARWAPQNDYGFSPAEMDGRWNMEQWRELWERIRDRLTLRWMFETAIGDGT